MKDCQQIHADAKKEATSIAGHAAATKGGPYIAAEKIVARRASKGVKAALVAALTVAELYRNGNAGAADQLTKELALMLDERLT
jgi:hypothetical protein